LLKALPTDCPIGQADPRIVGHRAILESIARRFDCGASNLPHRRALGFEQGGAIEIYRTQ
jgi:hypothetical protein